MSEITWHHGHSYYTTPDCDHALFRCLDCGKDINAYDSHHCWDCMAKFCDDCWGLWGLKHEDEHHY